jgi:hypothetical protein
MRCVIFISFTLEKESLFINLRDWTGQLKRFLERKRGAARLIGEGVGRRCGNLWPPAGYQLESGAIPKLLEIEAELGYMKCKGIHPRVNRIGARS